MRNTFIAFWRRSFSSLTIAMCAISLLAGCGRDNKIYSDPIVPSGDEEPRLIDGRKSLPPGFFDHSVNQASVEMSLDGTTDRSVAIRLITWPERNRDHAFNGSGRGNRALLGIAHYSGRKLSEIGNISFDAKLIVPAHNVELLLVTDLYCDGSDIRVLIADADALSSFDFDLAGDGYIRYRAGLNDQKWKALDNPIMDPENPAIELIPDASGLDAADLTALIDAYPNACIRNSVTKESEMPRELPVSGVLFSLGHNMHIDYAGAFIRRIEIGTDVYDSSDWSAQ